MRQRILETIRALQCKEADSGRYLPVKRQLHEILNGAGAHMRTPDRKISKLYDLDAFDYNTLTDEQLLSIFINFCRREWTQR